MNAGTAFHRAELQHEIGMKHRHIQRLRDELEGLRLELEELERLRRSPWISPLGPTNIQDYLKAKGRT
jgi:hypothetical protein